MKEISIIQAEVSIAILRVGNKSLTKAVFAQIPRKSYKLGDVILGYVANMETGYSKGPYVYLAVRDDTLIRLVDWPNNPRTFEDYYDRTSGCTREEVRGWYDEAVPLYNGWLFATEGKGQLYIAV